MRSAPLLLDHLDSDDALHFAEVRALLEEAGVSYELDPTLVRGLDYYTRTVFEFTSERLGAQSGVGGGGRYDGLVEMIKGAPTAGATTPGLGWAAGIERILLAGTPPVAQDVAIDLYVALEDLKSPPQGGAGGSAGAIRRAAFKILHEARNAGLNAQMELAGRSLKKQLEQAGRLGARHVVIVGLEETVLKDTRAGTEATLAANAMIDAVLTDVRER
jgi:histidyl-tRNA synthetase